MDKQLNSKIGTHTYIHTHKVSETITKTKKNIVDLYIFKIYKRFGQYFVVGNFIYKIIFYIRWNVKWANCEFKNQTEHK